MKDIKRGLWLMVVGILMLVGATYVRADEPGDERGCYAKWDSMKGQFYYEPFLKVPTTTDGEEGEIQVWGFRPWNLEAPKADGKTYPVNIPETRYIRMGVNKEVPMSDADHLKATRCPDVLWK